MALTLCCVDLFCQQLQSCGGVMLPAVPVLCLGEQVVVFGNVVDSLSDNSFQCFPKSVEEGDWVPGLQLFVVWFGWLV